MMHGQKNIKLQCGSIHDNNFCSWQH